MSALSHALGVLVGPPPSRNRPRPNLYGNYIHEVLSHAGLCYSSLSRDDLPGVLSTLRILVTVGEFEFDVVTQSALANWVKSGGAWLAVSGLCGANALFGADPRHVPESLHRFAPASSKTLTLGEGYLAPSEPHRILQHIVIPLHFFSGLQVQAHDSAQVLALVRDAHGHSTELPAILENRVGQGRCLFVAPDPLGAIIRIQQGTPVSADGVPSPDGLSPVTDGLLKCDDGLALDWKLDQEPVPGAEPLRAFLQPVADQWRELLLRAIFHLAEASDTALPLLWLYPGGAQALAHMSHDTDGNDAAHGEFLLDLLDEAGIRSTWCVIHPGYSPELMQEIDRRGHELAVHYDALEHPWSEAEFRSQIHHLTELSARPLVTNKNHFTRWEGYTDFFSWCTRQGIQIDSSKLGSKLGNQGFTFGSCHPHFPVEAAGNPLDVVELPCHMGDLEIVCPAAVAAAVQSAVIRHHGILHLLFHPAHTHKPAVAAALREAVRQAKAAGLEWWTAEAINTWERARRTVRWQSSTTTSAVFTCGLPLPEATLLILRGKSVHANDKSCAETTSTFWGFQFTGTTLDLLPGQSYELSWKPTSQS